MKALLVFGARPNFMKIAPIHRAMATRTDFQAVLVHTGQHFDQAMSGGFIQSLELPEPDVNLGVGPGTQAWQIAEIMHRIEPIYESERPDVTVVVGDVSSTLAASLVSATIRVPIAHVEAGLRSRDWAMPEERNRVLTDRMSQWLFTPSADADDNLRAEGIEDARIHMVGNVMIDSLDWVLPRLDRDAARARYDVAGTPYGLVTLHRPSNVDDPATLAGIAQALLKVGSGLPLLFPVHPRTRKQLGDVGRDLSGSGLRLLEPLDYITFMSLLADATMVLTDSGGIQEEALVLGVPCLTLRENTERPITVEYGGNQVVGVKPEAIVAAAERVLSGFAASPRRPPLWDGQTAGRIVDVLRAG